MVDFGTQLGGFWNPTWLIFHHERKRKKARGQRTEGCWIRRPLACKGAGRVRFQHKILPELRVPLILPAAARPIAFSYRLLTSFFSFCLPRASKSLQEAIQNRISFSASFFHDFWLQLGPNLAPTWPQLAPNLGPKSLQNPSQEPT